MPEDNHAQPKTQDENQKLSRRDFLKTAGMAVATAIGLSACKPGTEAPAQQTPAPVQIPLSNREQYPDVPGPDDLPPDGVMGFFTPHEAKTVEALVATILPGTPDDPGAREAGVVYYIDACLAYQNGFTNRTYHRPPYAMAYEGETPPEGQTPEGMNMIWVPKDLFERYGWQSILTPREMYRMGIMAVDRYAQEQHGGKFVELSAEQQEQIVGDMVDDKLEAFGNVTSQTFFEVLREHIIEGMFSDPVYRGNRGLVGWQLIGYPGAQRAYTPVDMANEHFQRNPQSMEDLHIFNPGEPGHPGAIMPVSGSGTAMPDRGQFKDYSTPHDEKQQVTP